MEAFQTCIVASIPITGSELNRGLVQHRPVSAPKSGGNCTPLPFVTSSQMHHTQSAIRCHKLRDYREGAAGTTPKRYSRQGDGALVGWPRYLIWQSPCKLYLS